MARHFVQLFLAATLACAAVAGPPLFAQFNDPIAVTSDASGFGDASVACDAVDNRQFTFAKEDQIFFASTVLGLGQEIAVTTAPGARANPHIVEGGLGFVYIAFDEESSAPGAIGSDILLGDNIGGPFDGFTTLTTSLDDDAFASLARGNLGAVYVAWQRTPAAGAAEIYLSPDLGPEEFVAEGTAPELVTTLDGAAHIFYLRDGDVHYRAYSGGAFNAEETIVDLVSEITGVSVAVGSGDTLHVLCTTASSLEYLNDEGGGFSAPMPIASVTSSGTAAIAARASGAVAAAYASGGHVFVLEQDAGSFGAAIDVTPEAIAATAPDLCHDSLEYVHIAYEESGAIYSVNNVPAPTADFTADVLVGEAPLAVTFTAVGSGVIDLMLWDFGDGETSNLSQPQHIFELSGPKTVTLTVTGPGGSDSETKTAYIDVLPATHIMKIPDINVFAGEQNVLHPILATNQVELQGFQVVVGFDYDKTPITAVSLEGSLTESEAPEFVVTEITPDGVDSTLLLAVILDVEPPFTGRVLRAGTNSVFASMEYDMPIGLSIGDTAAIVFLDALGVPPIFNVFNTEDGDSILPLLIPGGVTISTSATTTFLRGDINLGGSLDLADAITILVYLFANGPVPACPDAADVNDSGNIDLADPISLLTYLFFDGVSPPYPFPGEGLDSTADTLDDC